MTVNLKDIDPKKSDKFSVGLNRFMRKHKHQALNVYTVKSRSHIRPRLFIGHTRDEPGWFYGVDFFAAIHHGGRAEVFAFPPGLGMKFEPIPDFWERYIKVGRCAFDPDHKSYGERWESAGDTRTCRWCGVVQRRVTWTETVERERWEATDGNAN